MPPVSLISGPPQAPIADDYANPTASAIYALPGVWNGTGWDRVHEGAVAGSVLADVADRSGRLLGHVTVDNLPSTQAVSIAATVTTDPVDEPARQLGVVSVTGTPNVNVTNEFSGDIVDRSARLLGHVTVDNTSLTTDVQDRSARLLGQAGNLVYDGANWQAQGGIVGDTGQNAGLIAGNRHEVPFSTTTAQPVASTDVSNYRWVSVQVNSQGTSSTVTFQGSNDNGTWVSVGLIPVAQGNPPQTTSTSVGMWAGPCSYRYFRLNVTGISSGTTAGTIELFSVPPTMSPANYVFLRDAFANNISVASADAMAAAGILGAGNMVFNGTTFDRMRSWASAGNTTGAGVPAAGLIGWDSAGNAGRVISVASADAISSILTLGAGCMVYNGTTFDRARAASLATGTPGTGVPAAGVMGWDGTNYQRLLSETSGRLNTVLYTVGGATIQNAANVTDGNGGAGILGVGNAIFNGTTWDRERAANPTGAAIGTVGVPAAALHVWGSAGATYTPLQNANSQGDAVSLSAGLPVGTYLWNGTGWDRARSATGTTGMAAVSPQAATAGGATAFRLLSAATTNLTPLKAGAGMVYNITAYNAAASLRYLKLYNKATAPAPATDTPIATYPLAASGGQLQIAFPVGLQFTTGIAFSITALLADADTTAIAANDVILNIDYK